MGRLVFYDVLVTIPKDCPPPQAQPPSGRYYFLARKSAACGDTLGRPDWILPKDKPKGELAGRPDVCAAWAYSLFVDSGTLLRARSREPWVRKKCIAVIELSEADGVVLESSSSLGEGHHDWWPADYDADLGGTVVEEASA